MGRNRGPLTLRLFHLNNSYADTNDQQIDVTNLHLTTPATMTEVTTLLQPTSIWSVAVENGQLGDAGTLPPAFHLSCVVYAAMQVHLAAWHERTCMPMHTAQLRGNAVSHYPGHVLWGLLGSGPWCPWSTCLFFSAYRNSPWCISISSESLCGSWHGGIGPKES